MKEDPAVQAGRRAARYWNVDGLAELYIGVVWLFVAISLYLGAHLEKTSPWYKPLILAGTLAWMGAILGGHRIVGAVKSRVTYPRTGYVAYAKPNVKVWWAPAIILLLLGILPFGPPQVVLPVTGLIGAAIAVSVAMTSGVRRMYVLGGLILALGVALGAVGVGLSLGFTLLFGVAGAAHILSGGIVLRHYLQDV